MMKSSHPFEACLIGWKKDIYEALWKSSWASGQPRLAELILQLAEGWGLESLCQERSWLQV